MQSPENVEAKERKLQTFSLSKPLVIRTFILKLGKGKNKKPKTNRVKIMVVYDDNNKLTWTFCSSFSIWSLVLAEKPQKDEIFSVGCALWNLYLKLWTDRSCVSYICGDAWCIAEDSKVDCYGWEQIVIYVNCGFQDHTQSKPLMWTSGTHMHTDTKTYQCTHSVTHTFTHSRTVFTSYFQFFLLFFMSDSLISSTAWLTIL